MKAKLIRKQPTIPSIIEKLLDLSCETLTSRDELRRRLKNVDGEVARGVEERKALEAELCNEKLKLEFKEN